MLRVINKIAWNKFPKYKHLIETAIRQNPGCSELASFYLKNKYELFSPQEFVKALAPVMKMWLSNTSVPEIILGEQPAMAARIINEDMVWKEVLIECGLTMEEALASADNTEDSDFKELVKENSKPVDPV